MTKEQVLNSRDTLFAGMNIKLLADNMRKYNSVTDCIIWDDQNEMCYVIRFNTNNSSDQDKYPITIDTFTYETIQYITSDLTFDDTETVLDKIGTDLMTSSNCNKDAIMKYFKGMTDTEAFLK